MKRIRTLALWSFCAVGIGLSGCAGLEAEVTRILAPLTLAQQIGQIAQAEIKHVTPARVSEFNLGSVL